MTAGITRDLSAKLQGDIGAALERNLHVFAAVLEPAELSLVMIEAAVMASRTTAATIAGFVEAEKVATMYGGTIDAIIEQLQNSKADGIARTVAALRARG